MKFIFSVCILLALTFGALAVDVPYSFNYQGVLRDGDGSAVEDLSQVVEFRLYSVPSAGEALWGRSYSVLLETNGLFNIELSDSEGSQLPGLTAGLHDTILANQTLYLGLTVAGSTEIAPRQQLLSVPYAILAGDVKHASGNFTVAGELDAEDGANVTGTLQANQVLIQTTDGLADVTLNVNEYGALTVPKLDVNGQISIEDVIHLGQAGNSVTMSVEADDRLQVPQISATESAHLAAVSVSGQTTLSGPVQMFGGGTAMTSFDTYTGGEQTLFADAASDGFLILNLEFDFTLNGGKEKNEAQIVLSFTSGTGTHDRTLYIYFYEYDVDGGHIKKKDVYTLPVMKGETVTMSSSNWQLDDGSVKENHMFLPFGIDR